MTANFTNQTKNSATMVNPNKYGIAIWDDSDVDWDDALFSWDSAQISMTNQTKNSANISNQTKN